LLLPKAVVVSTADVTSATSASTSTNFFTSCLLVN